MKATLRQLLGRPLRACLAALLTTAAIPAASLADASPRPCDIYAAAGTPCVAAHSSTRALFADYAGPLYRVKRASDGTSMDIETLPDGYANAAAQDAFCASTSCTVTVIYDQTVNHNDLTIEGGSPNGSYNTVPKDGVSASALPVLAGGHAVYGLEFVDPPTSADYQGKGNPPTGAYLGSAGGAGEAYDDLHTKGVATNGQPESVYGVFDGTKATGGPYFDGCCFDYGNAEKNAEAGGNGHMDALNFSTECWSALQKPCSGTGPWPQADLENGLFQSANGPGSGQSGLAYPFATAMLTNDGQHSFALKGANAQQGSLTTFYSGPLPNGYGPMHQEGAIILGSGGDNSTILSGGAFFEGAMTLGVPTDAAQAAVQANIVAVGYAQPPLLPALP